MRLSRLFFLLSSLFLQCLGLLCWEGHIDAIIRMDVAGSAELKKANRTSEMCQITMNFPDYHCHTEAEGNRVTMHGAIVPKKKLDERNRQCDWDGRWEAVIAYTDEKITKHDPADMLVYFAHTPMGCGIAAEVDNFEARFIQWVCAMRIDPIISDALENDPGCSNPENGKLREGISGKNGRVKGCQVMEEQWKQVCTEYKLSDDCSPKEQYNPTIYKEEPYPPPDTSKSKTEEEEDEEEEDEEFPAWAIALITIGSITLVAVPAVAAVVYLKVSMKEVKGGRKKKTKTSNTESKDKKESGDQKESKEQVIATKTEETKEKVTKTEGSKEGTEGSKEGKEGKEKAKSAKKKKNGKSKEGVEEKKEKAKSMKSKKAKSTKNKKAKSKEVVEEKKEKAKSTKNKKSKEGGSKEKAKSTKEKKEKTAEALKNLKVTKL